MDTVFSERVSATLLLKAIYEDAFVQKLMDLSAGTAEIERLDVLYCPFVN